jgi:hypothetical protein
VEAGAPASAFERSLKTGSSCEREVRVARYATVIQWNIAGRAGTGWPVGSWWCWAWLSHARPCGTQFYPRAPSWELAYAFQLAFGSGMAASIILGFDAIRRGDVAYHRACMARLCVVSFTNLVLTDCNLLERHRRNTYQS